MDGPEIDALITAVHAPKDAPASACDEKGCTGIA